MRFGCERHLNKKETPCSIGWHESLAGRSEAGRVIHHSLKEETRLQGVAGSIRGCRVHVQPRRIPSRRHKQCTDPLMD